MSLLQDYLEKCDARDLVVTFWPKGHLAKSGIVEVTGPTFTGFGPTLKTAYNDYRKKAYRD